MESFWILIKYALLGLIQGVTEPIPVSSSGHVMILQHLFGLQIEGLGFAVLVNTASLLAIMFIYRHDLVSLTSGTLRYLFRRDSSGKSDFMFVVYLVIGTIPAAIIGLLFKDVINEALENIRTIGITLIITGVALWLIRKLQGYKQEGGITFKDALIVGFAQAVALIPGMSRSGSTVVASMAMGMNRTTALKFSFFLYIPVSFGSLILEGPDLFKDPDIGQLLIPYIVAFIVALIASYYALRWFMGIMARGNLIYFSLYCFVAGTAVLLFLR